MNKENTAYELGKVFYKNRVERLVKELPKVINEGKVYDEVIIREEIEMSKLKSKHLDRRKEKGLLE